MSSKKAILGRVLFAAEQHFDYMRRSLASESGRYSVHEHDQLWSDILRMRDFVAEMEEPK